MRLASKLMTLGLLATFAAASVSPALADRASDQTNKNNMRNLAIAGAAVAAYGLLKGNNTATLLGAAGAALAGSQYEKDRKQQSQDNSRYYDRGGQRWNDNQRWNRNGDQRWNGDQHRNGDQRWNGDQRRNGDHRYDVHRGGRR